jgi:uncharacterized OB-fold protein
MAVITARNGECMKNKIILSYCSKCYEPKYINHGKCKKCGSMTILSAYDTRGKEMRDK